MKNEFDEALYLVDGSYYFHLEEVKEGFRYAAYDADTKQFLASDLIRNEDILESPIRNPIAAARILASERKLSESRIFLGSPSFACV